VGKMRILSLVFVFFFCSLSVCSGTFAQQCETCGVWGPGAWEFPDNYPNRGLQLEVYSVDGVNLTVLFVLQSGPQWKINLEKMENPRIMPPWAMYGVTVYQTELKQKDGGYPYFMLGKGKFTLKNGVLFGVAEKGAIKTTLKRTIAWDFSGF
jgi:hypothetical protein